MNQGLLQLLAAVLIGSFACSSSSMPASGRGRPAGIIVLDRPAPLQDEAAYSGYTACESCHPDESSQWLSTAHAKPFAGLAGDSDRKRPECLRCHSTGFGEPSGYEKSGREDLAVVGCENCHGPRRAHVEARQTDSVVWFGADADEDCLPCSYRSICFACHNASQSPEFQFHKAYRTISHGDS